MPSNSMSSNKYEMYIGSQHQDCYRQVLNKRLEQYVVRTRGEYKRQCRGMLLKDKPYSITCHKFHLGVFAVERSATNSISILPS